MLPPSVSPWMWRRLGDERRDGLAVEISGVAPRHGDDLITAARLEHPRMGPVDGFAFAVYGWVVGKAPAAEVGSSTMEGWLRAVS